MAATVSEVFPHTIPKIRIESKQGNEMSNLRTEFNEALGLIEGQPFFVATVTPRSFFKDAGDRRSSLKAGATIKKEDEQLECCTVIARCQHHTDRGADPFGFVDAIIRSEERRVGKEWAVRVNLGGRRFINKKKHKKHNTQ